MIKKRKSVDLDRVKNGVEKGVKITGIVLRVTWTLIGVAVLAAFIFVALRIGQALNVYLSKIV